MIEIPIKEATPGMVVLKDVRSPKGQLLVNKNSVLSYQMIEHVKYYKVNTIFVQESVPKAEKEAAYTAEVETYSQRVRKSSEFKEFTQKYSQKVDLLKDQLNKFILDNDSFDTNYLLGETLSLFSKNSTTFSMFDMLHNMREIDDSTYAHSVNVSIIARMIGIWLNFPEEDLDLLTLCGLLHDIGKSKIQESIIGKPGKLTDSEYKEIKKHPLLGYQMLKPLPIDERIKNAALLHHERFDGKGYPMGLHGRAIDDFSAIVSIADVYDAMTANRCYRAGLCPFEVIAMFENEGLTKFKTEFILTFLEHIANTYINNEVLLSNGQTGKIVLIGAQLTRPTILLDNNEFINLENSLDVYVQAII